MEATVNVNRRRRGRGLRRGFTLIEAALATVIVGVGVLAMVAAQAAFHQKNAWSTHASTAMRLGNEIRELTFNLPRHDPVTGQAYWGPEPKEEWVGDFDDLDDFDGVNGNGIVYSAADGTGPINARREVIPGMEGWSQTVTVSCVDPLDITKVVDDFTSPLLRVEVVVHYQGPTDDQPVEITRVSWISPK